MSQAQTRPCVLVVGRNPVDDMVGRALERDDLQPVWRALTPDLAFTIAAQQRPGFIVLDFDMTESDAEVVADVLRVLAPQSWIIDFSGLVRRRPENAHVDFETTRPLVFVTDQPSI